MYRVYSYNKDSIKVRGVREMGLLERFIRFSLAILLSINFNFLPYSKIVSNYAFAQELGLFSLSLVGIREDENAGLRFIFKDGFKMDKEVDGKDVASLLKQGPIRFFLIALSLPDNEMWVNLSPDLDETGILGKQLGKTDLGRMLLFYDLM